MTSSSRNLHRSKSLSLTRSRTHVLTPSRGDRMRLELLIADIWSRDILPFSNMPYRARSELRRRNSTSTMMRKLSLSRRSSTSRITQRSGEGGSLRALRRPGRGLVEDTASFGENEHANTPDTPEHSPKSRTSEPNHRQVLEPPEPVLIEEIEFSEKDELGDVIEVAPGPEKKPSETSILCMSDANSLHLTMSHPSIKAFHSWSRESKENVYRPMHQARGSNNRGWGRVGSLRGESRGHSFRNLFR